MVRVIVAAISRILLNNSSFKLDLQKIKRVVAQPGSAHVWGAWGRKFESCLPDKKRNQRLSILVNIIDLQGFFLSLCQIESKNINIQVSKSVSILRHRICTHPIAHNLLQSR